MRSTPALQKRSSLPESLVLCSLDRMWTRYFVLVIALSIALAATARSATLFEKDPIFLYQPDAQLRARLKSADDLVAHIKRIQAAGRAFFASERTPETLDVVVGVKPGKKVRIWLISSRRTSGDKALVLLRRKLEAIPPCAAHRGPIAFALRWTIAGGGAVKTDGAMPIPKEWRDTGNVSVPDGVFERIWPN